MAARAASIVVAGAREVAAVETDVTELDLDPGHVLGVARSRRGRLLHGLQSALTVTHQLADVGDAGVGTEVGPEIDHRLDRLDGIVVAAELDLRVADDAVDGGVVGIDGAGLLAPIEGGGELMPSQRQGAQPDDCVDVVGVTIEGLLEESFGFGVVAGITGFAHLLQVRLCRAASRPVPFGALVAAQGVLER